MKTRITVEIEFEPPYADNYGWWFGFKYEAMDIFPIVPHIMHRVDAWEQLAGAIRDQIT